MKNMRKKSIAVLAGVALAGAVGASAATLNGVDGNTLGAGAGDVTSCDSTGVSITYDTIFSAGEYIVQRVNVGGVDALCEGLDYDVTLVDDSDVELGSRGGVVALTGDTFSVTMTAQAVSAEAVEGVALTISG